MVAYLQTTRLLAVNTPAGKDVLQLAGFSGTETMSRLFSYQLDMLSTKLDLSPKDVVGKNVTWSVQLQDRQPRYFNGFVSRFSGGGKALQNLRAYRAEVVPWLWFLTRTSNCRIFQKQNALQIIEKVFKDLGLNDYKTDVKRKPREREYCVQYRETAFNFVSRLMEEEGMFYFFQHENGKHTLMIADHKGAYKDAAEPKVRHAGGMSGPGLVSDWSHNYEFRPGKWAHTDYNFETPSTPLLTNIKTAIDQPGMDKYEIFDYPGDYFVKSDGDAELKLRMEEEEAAYDVVQSASGCCTFGPGLKFKVDGHDLSAENGKGYVVTQVSHSATDTSHMNHTEGSSYHNSFTCIPDAVVYRAPRVTPKPTVMGPQPAVVVGPKGQEIYTDKYGRIKVQFFWDREGKKDENSSCWMRVSQPMAGKRWGVSFWPRIGQEVIVGFHEGDPDRPFILGALYNAEQMPPYQGDGPDDKHKSDNKVAGFKSNTTTGGVGFNELRFDDTKDKQEIFIHAERNLDTRVKKDAMELVLNNRHLIVGTEKDKKGDQMELVANDKHLNVKRNHAELIEGTMQLTVAKEQDILISGKKTETNGKDLDHHVKMNLNEKVDQKKSVTVGMDLHEKVGMNYAHESGMTVYIKAGMTLVLEAGMQLSLKVGGSFIDINPTGVAISGPMVLINSGGAAGSGTAPSPTEPQDAMKAEPTKPDLADDSKSGQKSAP